MSIMDMRPITVDVDNGVYETVVVLTDVPSEIFPKEEYLVVYREIEDIR